MGRRLASRRSLWWLLGVPAAFTLCQLVLVPMGMGPSWDETVYISQVSPYHPAAFLSAPRARGISLVVAPVAALTSSTAALRVYLALLSGAGLFGALWVWRRLRPAPALALAGLLFAGLWVTLFYGPQAMPNLWVALGALACAGFFLRAAADRSDRAALLGVGVTLAFVVLMRPGDGFWLGLPLGVAALAVPRWRRPALAGVVVAGIVVGGAEWVIEAYVRFGDVPARLHASSQAEGGMGWHLAFDDQVRAMHGTTLCRPCDIPWRGRITSVWWFALPVLAAGGVAAAARGRRLASALLPSLCGLSMAVPYLFLIDYAAPRFLLPAYALLAIPVADCLVWAVSAVPPRLRPVTAGLVAVGLAGHLAVQQAVLHRVTARTQAAHADYGRLADALHALGVRPPCLITGDQAIPVAFYARCSSGNVSGNNADTTPSRILATAAHRPVAVLVVDGHRPPGYTRAWPSTALPAMRQLPGFRAYVSPSADASTAARSRR